MKEVRNDLENVKLDRKTMIWGNIEIYTVQRKHIFIIFIYSQFYATVSDYRAVGLSSRRTIDTHPIQPLHIKS